MFNRLPKRLQVQSGAVITASGNSGNLNNPSTSQNPMVEAILAVTGAVTGTSPTLNVTVYEVDPVSGANIILGAFTQVTATLTNPLRLAFQPVFASQVYVAWVVGGTGAPTFNGVNIDLYFTPDGYA